MVPLILVLVAATAAIPGASAATVCPTTLGVRYLGFGNNQKVQVWYPSAAAERAVAYTLSFSGQGAWNAEPAACGPRPLVILSPGYGGCRSTSAFLTETLARRGYVVASLDHADSMCATLKLPPAIDFFATANWNDTTFASRAAEVRTTLDLLLADPKLGAMIDRTKIAGMGYSLGGYVMFGVAGGWESWYDGRIRSAILMVPFLAPYWASARVPAVTVPKLYHGGSNDLGSVLLRAPTGVYDRSTPYRALQEIAGAGHFAWTNAICGSFTTVASCVANIPTAKFIVDSTADFLSYSLEGTPASNLLTAPSPLLSVFKSDIVTAN